LRVTANQTSKSKYYLSKKPVRLDVFEGSATSDILITVAMTMANVKNKTNF